MEFQSQTYNFKAKYANQKPNLELNLVITGQKMLVQVSMETENFVIFSILSWLFPFQGNLPITFKHNEDIGKFLWKIQKKHGNPFWGGTGSFYDGRKSYCLGFLNCIFQTKVIVHKMFMYHSYRHKMSVKYLKDDTTSSELNEDYNRLYA